MNLPAALDELPEAELLVEMDTESLAAHVLFQLQSVEDHLNIQNFRSAAQQLALKRLPSDAQASSELPLALMEAWNWLETHGLIVGSTSQDADRGFRELSRKARKIDTREELSAYTFNWELLPKILHPRIAGEVKRYLAMGKFDHAVFECMKEVEIAVRKLAKLKDEDVGVKLMRRAFGPGGRLRLADPIAGEAEAIANLFDGAIGTFKNPQSHRTVGIDDFAEAAEIAMLASLLIRIAERHAEANGSPPPQN